jgi:heterotetrameric sarcosine oxidase delta subunit
VLIIDCPHCGPRVQAEYTYGGADLPRPADDASTDEWLSYVYLRDNPKGPHTELWQHSAGCRAWLSVRRDTRTHDIIGVEPAR